MPNAIDPNTITWNDEPTNSSSGTDAASINPAGISWASDPDLAELQAYSIRNGSQKTIENWDLQPRYDPTAIASPETVTADFVNTGGIRSLIPTPAFPALGAAIQNTANRIGIGLDSKIAGWGSSLEQAYYGLTGQTDKQQQLSKDIAETRHLNEPIGRTFAGSLGEAIPNIAASVAAPEAGFPGFLAQSGAQGALGFMEPTAPGESHLANAGWGTLGGALGQGAGAVGGRLVQPFRQNLSPEYQASVNLLKDAGVPLNLPQQTGSRLAGSAQRFAMDSPIFGESARTGATAEGFNGAVLHQLGGTGDLSRASPQVMDPIQRNIVSTLKTLTIRNTPSMWTPGASGNYLGDELNNFLKPYTSKHQRPDEVSDQVIKEVSRIFKGTNQNTGEIDPETFSNVQNHISDWSQKGADFKEAGGQLRSILDGAMNNYSKVNNPGDFEVLQSARNAFHNLQGVQKSIDANTDLISPTKLMNNTDNLRNINQTVYGRGNQDFINLAQAGSRILPDRTPQSGTVPRLLGQAAVGGALMAAPEALQGNWEEAGKMGAFGLAAPWALRQLTEGPVGNILARNANSSVATNLLRPAITHAATGYGGSAGATRPDVAISAVEDASQKTKQYGSNVQANVKRILRIPEEQ